MNRIKSLVTAAVLTLALAVAAMGQQSPDCKPGEILTPPCTSASTYSDDPVVPGEILTPPMPESVEIVSLVDLALAVLLLF